jgi:hypothetical protein
MLTVARFSSSPARCGAGLDDGDVLVVSSGDEVVDRMLLDEGNLVARSARSRC